MEGFIQICHFHILLLGNGATYLFDIIITDFTTDKQDVFSAPTVPS